MAKSKKRNKLAVPGLHKASRQWTKRHKGKSYWFGTNESEALARFAVEWPRIVAGKPRFGDETETPANVTLTPASGVLTVRSLVNQFLSAKRAQMEIGGLSPSMWGEYHSCGKKIAEFFGPDVPVADLRPANFNAILVHMAKTLGKASLSKFVTITKTIFGYVQDTEPPERPVYFGKLFKKPNAADVREEADAKPDKLLSAEDWNKLIDGAGVPMRAFLLLSLNCGYGARDCSELPRRALTKRPGWVIFPRPKTKRKRIAPLWVETQEALRAVAMTRPAAKNPEDDDCVFLTKNGVRYVRYIDHGASKRGVSVDSILGEFKKLATRTGVKLPTGFYLGRHCHRTLSGHLKDPECSAVLMGHAGDAIAEKYTHGREDSRLLAITNHIRDWLHAGRQFVGPPAPVVIDESPATLPFKVAS